MNRIVRRATPARTALLLAAAALATFAIATPAAQARVVQVTGGQATFTPSSQLAEALSSKGIIPTAIPPASLDDGALTLPVVGGRVARPGLHGYLALGGGVKLARGSHSVALRRLVAVHSARGSFLTALVAGQRRVIARFTRITKTISGHTATLSANVVLSAEAAALINAVAGHHVVSRGAPLGTATATVALG